MRLTLWVLALAFGGNGVPGSELGWVDVCANRVPMAGMGGSDLAAAEWGDVTQRFTNLPVDRNVTLREGETKWE